MVGYADGGYTIGTPNMSAGLAQPMQDLQNQSTAQSMSQPQQSSGPQSSMGKLLGSTGIGKVAQGAMTIGSALGIGGGNKSTPPPIDPSTGAAVGAKFGPATSAAGASEVGWAKGGMVPVALSPGEVKLPPKAVDKVKKGADPLAVGGKVPGKSPHPGNDYRNDTYKTKAEPGTIIIPKSVLESKNPHKEAYAFVNKILAKRGKKP
jgi:hypothetical protein